MKKVWISLNKTYFINFTVILLLLLSIFLMFFVQFKVESLHEEMAKIKNEILSCEDETRLLEVQWVYLTRPERLRTLAAKYLQNNGYALASQIKDDSQLEKFYQANYQKTHTYQTSSNHDSQSSTQVSF